MREKVVHCKGCGRHEQECGRLSRRNLCAPCGLERMVAAVRAMQDKAGPQYQAWLNSAADRPGQPAVHRVRYR